MSEKKVIGFYMRQNKRDRFNWDSGFIPAAEKRGYSVVPCDGTDENQKLDVIIAKLTDEFGSFHEESCQQVIARFQKLEEKNIPIIDPVEAQRIVADRNLLDEALIQMPFDKTLIHLPKSWSIESEEDLNSTEVNFPVIMKPMIASGSHAAHEMAIIFNLEQLNKHIKYPAFVQEYYNHNGTIFKISVVGAHIHSGKKASTRNFAEEDQNEPVFFNSQNMKTIIDPDSYKNEAPLEHSALEHITKCISSSLGMHLYGFDVIKNVKTNKLAIIDVNFFPSFSAVPDIFERFLDMFDMVTKR